MRDLYSELLCDALVLSGKSMTVDEVMEQVLADVVYYEKSGGGVTLSGASRCCRPSFVWNF